MWDLKHNFKKSMQFFKKHHQCCFINGDDSKKKGANTNTCERKGKTPKGTFVIHHLTGITGREEKLD